MQPISPNDATMGSQSIPNTLLGEARIRSYQGRFYLLGELVRAYLESVPPAANPRPGMPIRRNSILPSRSSLRCARQTIRQGYYSVQYPPRRFLATSAPGRRWNDCRRRYGFRVPPG
jgi:hypothetical protein